MAPPVNLASFNDKIRQHFGDRFEIDWSEHPDGDFGAATGYDLVTGSPVLIRLVEDLGKRDRIHLEYEVSQLRNLQSDFLANIVEAVFHRNYAMIVSERRTADGLDQIVRRTKLDVPNSLEIGICLFSALRDLHERHIFHLDVRPTNVLVDENCRAWLVRPLSTQTSDDVRTERAFFYAPEKAGSIDRDISAPADLYSAGIILFYAITGHVPYAARDLGSILLAHMTEEVPQFLDYGIVVPSALQTIVNSLLKIDPADRYQSAEAVLFDLTQLRDALTAGEDDPDIALGSHDHRLAISEPCFVGRSRELVKLSRATDLAKTGTNQLVVLEGESGIGKSRLLAEVARHAAQDGALVFLGQSNDTLTHRSLTVFDGVVETFTRQYKHEDFARQFKNSFDGEPQYLAKLFPGLSAILEVDHPGDVSESLGEQRSLSTLCAFVNSLGSANSSCLLILDDCQWADDLTRKFLKYWWKVGGNHHVTIMIVFRSEEVPGDDPLRQFVPSAHVQLGPLRANDVKSLLESMAGTLPATAVELITRISNGSPFMASAVLRGLVESNALERDGPHWRINEESFVECQSSDQAAEFLAKRLQLLDAESIGLLTAGAILGKEFDLDLAAHLVGVDTNSALKKCQDARQRNLIWLREEGIRCVFSHDKIREALLERVNEEARQQMHLQAAEFLLSQTRPNVAEVSIQFDAAGHPERSLPFALEAAELAYQQHAFEVATRQYSIALRGSGHADQGVQFQIAKGLGEVLMLRGDYVAAERQFRSASRFAHGEVQHAETLGALADTWRRRGKIREAIKHYRDALRRLGYDTPSNIGSALLKLGWECGVQVLHTLFPRFLVGRFRRPLKPMEKLALRLFEELSHAYYHGNAIFTIHTHLRTMNFLERFEVSANLASLYAEHAVATALVGLRTRSIKYAEKSLAIHRKANDVLGQGQALFYYGVGYYAAGKYDLAIQQCRASLKMLEKTGDFWGIHMGRWQIAASLYHKGRFREAIEEAKINYESGIETGDYQASGIILDVWARANPGGVPDEILEEEFSRERHDPQSICQVHVAKAANEVGHGKFQQAYETAYAGAAIAFKAGVLNPYIVPAFVWGAIALRKKAETLSIYADQERKQTLRRAAQMANYAWALQWLYPVGRPTLLRELALIRMLQHRPFQAKKLLKRSLAVAKKQNADYDYAESLRRLGELGEAQGWKGARDQLQQARELLNRLQFEHGIADEDGGDSDDSLSLLARFDTILEVGRRITAALTKQEVFEQTRQAASLLLRCEDCVIVEDDGSGDYRVASGKTAFFSKEAIAQANNAGRAISDSSRDGLSLTGHERGSVLGAPIYVLGKSSAVLYATHDSVRQLFGNTEERLADFVCTIAGASLENAQSFSQLNDLNTTLEDRVAERTEQLRQAIDEANSANEAKSQFLATMSHEIRTPMNGIMGMTELALKTKLSPQQQNCLNVVKQSGETLLMLLNEILDLSKIESGKMELECIDFDLRNVVENAVQLLSASAHAKKLEVVCHIAASVPLRVHGDPNRLRQIIINLFGNAVKFTSEGDIVVAVTTRDDGAVQFSVKDSGIGIPEDKKELIFEAFRQSDSSTTRQYGGTGLGLSICRQLSQLMGGDINVESVMGEGSTFSFWVPFETSSDSQESLRETELSGIVAALICDWPSTRLANQTLLECLGISVTVFDTLSELDDEMIKQFNLVFVDEPTSDDENWLESNRDRGIALMLPQKAVEYTLPQVSKPMKYNELLYAIRDVLSLQGDSSARPPDVLVEEENVTYKILLADDSIVNQEVAKGLLEFAGHVVETADNGLQAVEKAAAEKFDVILMDLEMPEMDGLEATSEIRKTDTATPILALSAHATSELEARCEGLSMNGYCPKPIDPDQLLETIRDVVSRVEV